MIGTFFSSFVRWYSTKNISVSRYTFPIVALSGIILGTLHSEENDPSLHELHFLDIGNEISYTDSQELRILHELITESCPDWFSLDFLFHESSTPLVRHPLRISPHSPDSSLDEKQYEIEIAKDPVSNLPYEVRLVNLKANLVEAYISLEWDMRWKKVRSVSCHKNREETPISAHRFEYDERGRLIEHALTGNLTGKKGGSGDESYLTRLIYQNGMITLHGEDGIRKTFRSLNHDGVSISLCCIQGTDGLCLRKIIREWSEKTTSFYEEIEDDASSLEIIDDIPHTFRRWKKTSISCSTNERLEIHETGAYDMQKQDRCLLRKIVTRHDSASQLIECSVYDGNDTLVFSSPHRLAPIGKKNSPSSVLQHLKNHIPSENYEMIINGIGRLENSSHVDSMFNASFEKQLSYDLYGNIISQKTNTTTSDKSYSSRLRARYTGRKAIAAKEYEDGSQEIFRYTPSGLLTSHTLRNSTIITYGRDSLGRICTMKTKKPGSSQEDTVAFTYYGEDVVKIDDRKNIITLTRDPFGRVIRYSTQPISDQEPKETYDITYDALDRVIELKSVGKDTYTLTHIYDISQDSYTQHYSSKLNGRAFYIAIHIECSSHGTILVKRVENSLEKTITETSFDEKGREKSIRITATDDRFSPYYESISYEEADTTLTKIVSLPNGDTKKAIFNKNTGKILSQEINKRHPTPSLQDEVISQKSVWDWKDPHGSCVVLETNKLKSGKEIKKSYGWIFNEAKRLSEVISSDGLHEIYTYDARGRLIAVQKAEGSTIQYERNKTGQVTRLFSSDLSIDYEYRYNNRGLIVEARDRVHNKVVSRSYSSDGRLLQDGEAEKSIRITYDLNSQSVTEMALPDGAKIYYQGNERIEKTAGKSWFTSEWSLPLSDRQNPSSSLFQGVSSQGKKFEKKTDSQVIVDIFDAVTEEQGSCSYTLSLLPSGDVVGYSDENSIPVTTELDSKGRTIARGQFRFSYTETGNLARFVELDPTGNPQKNIEYTYDALGRISSASDLLGGLEEQYRYDGFHRIQEIICRDRTADTVISQKDRLWFSFTEIATVCTSYNHDLEEMTEVSLKVPDFQHSLFSAAAVEINGTPYRVIEDSFHTITHLMNTRGEIVETQEECSLFGHHTSPHKADKTHSVSPWLFQGKQKIAFSTLYDFGLRRYMPELFHWIEKDPMGFGDGPHCRAFSMNCPLDTKDPTGLFSIPTWFWDTIAHINKGAGHIYGQIMRSVTFAASGFDWFYEFRSLFEDMAFRLVNESWMKMIGYNPDASHVGCVGDIRKNQPKVRITHINGILNGSKDQVDNAGLVSLLHGNYPVYYVYAATTGFTGDLVRCAFAKGGIVSRQAKLLVALWKKLFQDMGGAESGGIIIHYAHSLGGTDTASALSILTPNERALIRVVTFGSATLIQEGLCHKIDNYVSLKDGVPFSDPKSYIQGIMGIQTNIHFLASTSLPLIDHLFSNETYRNVLDDLGAKFQEEYLKTKSL